MGDPREETNYDPALPGRIRRENEAEEPTAPTSERPRRRLPATALLAAVGILILGVIQMRLTSVPPAGPLALARRHLAERNWPRVSLDLDPLRAAGPLGAEASRLDETARGMKRMEEAERTGDWVTAYDTALDLKVLWKEEGALSVEIARRLDRARAEVLAGQKLAEARHRLASGDPQEALAALREVPEGTASAEAARAEVERALAVRRERAFAEAERAIGERRWQEARGALDAAEASGDPRAQDLARRIAEGLSQQEALGKARSLLGALRVEEALAALQEVDPRGPCAAERAELAAALEQAREAADRVGRARTLFDRGRGEEALAALPSEAGGLPAELRRGIAEALKAHQAVLDALDRRDDLGALEGVRALCAMPLAEGNWYRAEAAKARAALERKAAAQAEDWVAQAVAAFREKRYEESQAGFAKAERACPGHAVVSFYKAQFLREGQDLYRKGYILRAVDPAAARENFRLALVCLPPDDPTAEKARKALGE